MTHFFGIVILNVHPCFYIDAPDSYDGESRMKNSIDQMNWRNEIMLFVCYPKCSTCQKAKKWLDAKEISYEERDIKTENPTKEELTEWYKKSGLPLKRFFNTSGMLYKEMKLKDKLPEMSEDEQLTLLATDGMLVKRPLVVEGNVVLAGFKEAEWLEKLEV